MKVSTWMWVIGIILIIGGLMYWSANSVPSDDELLNYTLKEHTNLALHIHSILQIEILGNVTTLPHNIGISDGGMHVIHTHDELNKIHIEGPYVHQFYLRDFFTIWGKKFNESCIFEYCVDDKHTLKMYVNGVETHQFGNTPLYDNQMIRIVYAKK